ncbi:MAG TPA: hypothetical protein VIG88_07830 [Lysobacter sp.]
MSMDGGTLALAFALTSVPAFLVARSLARSRQRRDPDQRESRLALRLAGLMRIVGVAMLAAALAMLWAGDDPARVVAVVLAVGLAVNGLAVAMLVAVMRGRRR